jgi:hypothetical protein
MLVRIASRGGLIVLTNVDAQHDYSETRLPVGTSFVQAETFKHSRATINALLQHQCLRHKGSVLVMNDGQNFPLSDLAAPPTRGAVGWITAWERGE